MSDIPEVLVVCIHNAGRSVAARVLLDYYGQGRINVRSAGSGPGVSINPAVAAILAERGLDATKELSQAAHRRSRPSRRCDHHHGLR